MNTSTVIVILVLVVVAILAICSSLKHFKGQGGCCGGGEEVVQKAETKTLDHPPIGKKILRISGMHCDNCKNAVERQINRIEGASCQVDLKKGEATVLYDREISDKLLRFTVEAMEYKVEDIQTEPSL